MTTPDRGSDPQWSRLCETTRQLIPDEIGGHAWYLIVAAALITSPEPQLLGQFWTHLTRNDAAFGSEEEQRHLSRQFRDVCLKLITLVGAPQVLCALMPLAKAEGNPEAKAEQSTLNTKWTTVNVPDIHARGTATIDTIYGHLLPRIFSSWGDHKADVVFNEIFTVYGLYLSDFEYLTALETEAVVFTTISCTGLRGPSLWHLRGMGRLLGARGNNDEDEKVRMVKDKLRDLKMGIMAVVEWVGDEFVRRAKLENWCNVGDVTRELGGWGDDE